MQENNQKALPFNQKNARTDLFKPRMKTQDNNPYQARCLTSQPCHPNMTISVTDTLKHRIVFIAEPLTDDYQKKRTLIFHNQLPTYNEWKTGKQFVFVLKKGEIEQKVSAVLSKVLRYQSNVLYVDNAVGHQIHSPCDVCVRVPSWISWHTAEGFRRF